jgi:hypothetical protein
MEWLTMTGWSVEVSGGDDSLRGTATREVYGEQLVVDGEGSTRDMVAWTLVDRAEAELERWESRQRVAVAA